MAKNQAPTTVSPAELQLLKATAKLLRARGLARKLVEPALCRGSWLDRAASTMVGSLEKPRWVTFKLPPYPLLPDAEVKPRRQMETQHGYMTFRRAEKAGWVQIGPGLWVTSWNLPTALKEAKRLYNERWKTTEEVFIEAVGYLSWKEVPVLVLEDAVEWAMWRPVKKQDQVIRTHLRWLFDTDRLESLELDEDTKTRAFAWWPSARAMLQIPNLRKMRRAG